MAQYRDVKKRLGEKFVDKIHDHAVTISDDDLKEIATQLGEIPQGGPNRISGEHDRRMNRNMNRGNQVLLREMLMDWWNEELYGLSTEAGRKKLIDIFKSSTLSVKGNNKPLAEKLERMPTYHDPDGPPFEEVEETSGPNSQGSTPANNSAAGKGDAGGSAAGDSKSNGAGTSISAGAAININAGGDVIISGDQANSTVTKVQGGQTNVKRDMTTTSRDTLGGNAQVSNVAGDQTNVRGDQTVNNLYAHNIPPPELARLFTVTQKEKHKEFFKEEALKTIQAGSAQDITSMDKILRSVCMIECKGMPSATGFLVRINCQGGDKIAFMTAGHVFGDKQKEQDYGITELLPNIDLSQYELFFHCSDGDKRGSQVIRHTLADFDSTFKLRGSIAYMGKRCILPAGTTEAPVNSMLDFCALVLDNPDAEKKLEKMGLTWFQCGNGDYLNYIPGDVVSIYGYPGNEAFENGKRPLRMSYGKEMPPPGGAQGFLFYDNDTLPGNSGSPVIGRGSKDGSYGYAVKGIHVTGGRKANKAQGLQKLSDWIPKQKP